MLTPFIDNRIEKDLVSNLRQIQNTLKMNWDIKEKLNPELFHFLKKFKRLDLDSSQIKFVSYMLNCLMQLQNLALSSSKNQIEKLDANAFDYFKSLKSSDLSKNRISFFFLFYFV